MRYSMESLLIPIRIVYSLQEKIGVDFEIELISNNQPFKSYIYTNFIDEKSGGFISVFLVGVVSSSKKI